MSCVWVASMPEKCECIKCFEALRSIILMIFIIGITSYHISYRIRDSNQIPCLIDKGRVLQVIGQV